MPLIKVWEVEDFDPKGNLTKISWRFHFMPTIHDNHPSLETWKYKDCFLTPWADDVQYQSRSLQIHHRSVALRFYLLDAMLGKVFFIAPGFWCLGLSPLTTKQSRWSFSNCCCASWWTTHGFWSAPIFNCWKDLQSSFSDSIEITENYRSTEKDEASEIRIQVIWDQIRLEIDRLKAKDKA